MKKEEFLVFLGLSSGEGKKKKKIKKKIKNKKYDEKNRKKRASSARERRQKNKGGRSVRSVLTRHSVKAVHKATKQREKRFIANYYFRPKIFFVKSSPLKVLCKLERERDLERPLLDKTQNQPCFGTLFGFRHKLCSRFPCHYHCPK